MSSEYHAGQDECERCGREIQLSYAELCEDCAVALGRSVPRGRTTPH